MSFMEPQIVEGTWYHWEDKDGGTYWSQYPPEDTDAVFKTGEGFGARLSAPGYMDRTDWAVFDTEALAARYLIDAYYDQAPEDMSDDERTELAELEAIEKRQ